MAALELSRIGAGARDEACEHLRQAASYIRDARELVSREKGIGTEFFIEKLDDYLESTTNYISRLKKLKQN